MSLTRVLEPEVMDTAEEARDYDAMDHSAVNDTFCDDLLAEGSLGPSVLDVGTGTALIPIGLCRRTPDVRVVAVDLAEHMLSLARENVRRAGYQDRVMLEKIDAKRMPYEGGSFSATVSNSIVHHIPHPRAVLAEMIRVTANGGLLFVRDLARPESAAEVDRLVARYAGEPPADPSRVPAFERQRDLLRSSLHAALTAPEVSELLASLGITEDVVRMTSDRHWTLALRKAA